MILRRFFCILAALWQCHTLFAADDPVDPLQLKYNLATTVDAYDKVGRKNPKWDADARKSLIAYARIRSWTNAVPAELTNELYTPLQRLSDCDDPLIRYLYVRTVMCSFHSNKETAAAFVDAATALQNSDYPDIRKFYATLRAERAENSTNLLAANYLAKALADPAMSAREADQGCEQLTIDRSDRGVWAAYCIILPALTNRWDETSFAFLEEGRAYISYAWLARGNGYVDTVSSNGWELYGERLNTADGALEAAWKLNPHDVRICREMMRVELGEGEGRNRLDAWFQRGMKLDPANYGLCELKLWYLYPRWYGSWKDMIDFGRECTENTNWSGSVRLMLADAHYEVFKDMKDKAQREAYWRQTNVWSDIHHTYEQFFKLYPGKDMADYRQNYAWYAYQCGQWQIFEDQTKLFPWTNYAYFGGQEEFDKMLVTAEAATKKQ